MTFFDEKRPNKYNYLILLNLLLDLRKKDMEAKKMEVMYL
jgi:hypothetical protein